MRLGSVAKSRSDRKRFVAGRQRGGKFAGVGKFIAGETDALTYCQSKKQRPEPQRMSHAAGLSHCDNGSPFHFDPETATTKASV